MRTREAPNKTTLFSIFNKRSEYMTAAGISNEDGNININKITQTLNISEASSVTEDMGKVVTKEDSLNLTALSLLHNIRGTKRNN